MHDRRACADRGRQLADTHTLIDHAMPHGTSRQLHKCIVDGAAHAVFNGNIMVRPGAQRTDSAQSSRNLLLSAKARVDTKPQLEIFADDVKCAHGATVGQLDVDEVFYLKSRGLSDTAARNLLTYAFGAEVIERIPVASLRKRLEQTLLAQRTPMRSAHQTASRAQVAGAAALDVERIRADFPILELRPTASRWSIWTMRPPARCRSR